MPRADTAPPLDDPLSHDYQYCTLFDRNYLLRGLALSRSLARHAEGAVLWVLCMDQLTHEVLTALDLPHLRLLTLSEVEDEALKRVKPTRTAGEFCWTCTSTLILHVLRLLPEGTVLVYLDADVFFFNDPALGLEDLGLSSIGMTEHRFSPQRRHLSAQSGRFNVEFMAFRNDDRATTCLSWWRERCIEWCYDRLEDGRYGDQMYLNDWPERFEGVAILDHPGAGIAPWNLEGHVLSEADGRVLVDGQPLIFYHFHQFRMTSASGGFLPAQNARITSSKLFDPESGVGYTFTRSELRLLYEPYASELSKGLREVRAVRPGFSYGIAPVSCEERCTAARKRLYPWVERVPPLHAAWRRLRRLGR